MYLPIYGIFLIQQIITNPNPTAENTHRIEAKKLPIYVLVTLNTIDVNARIIFSIRYTPNTALPSCSIITLFRLL